MELIQVRLKDGTLIYAEADEGGPRARPDGHRERPGPGDQLRGPPARSDHGPAAQIDFQRVISTVRSVTKEMTGAFEDLDLGPSAYELTFGIKLTAEAGVIFAKTGGEASFEVKLSWDRTKTG